MSYSTSSRQRGKQGDREFPDSIYTDDKGWVRLGDIKHDQTIVIKGNKIYGHQIPLNIYTLVCGHVGKGVAVSTKDVIFCEECGTKQFVDSVR